MDIKKLRRDKQMSQASLAKASGLAQSTICYIETGQKNPSIKTAIKLADALGVDLVCLIKS
jgi:DNA-binding XRE family transcriptional regulator